ncbi:MAG TPA: cytochrome c3 family protein [Geobacteraceae bacterium]
MKINLLQLLSTSCILLFSSSFSFADSCVTTLCHPAIGEIKNLHQPVKDGDCSSCHQQKIKEHPVKGGKSFELTAKDAALCSQCHDPKGKKKVVHPPVKEGDCLACHKPHGGSGPYLLDVGENQSELCLGCHDAAPFKQEFMHGPVAFGACTKCHDPHESGEKALLKGPVRDLCLNCHADFATAMKEAAVVHPPVKKSPCTSCHNPHGTPTALLLRKKMPDLCVGCHVALGKKLAAVKVPHKPLTQEASCGGCHATHFAKARGLLAGDEKSVCLGCHDTDKLGTPPLKNIKKELEGKKYLHGPIQKGMCTPCHDPHGSDNFRMLKGSYPAELYEQHKEGKDGKELTYELCLTCHDKSMLRFTETTIYTKFRNGKRNLHYVHVVGKRKGRTCRVCHEPHASDGEKLIGKEGMKFGDWRIPLNFTITPTGGSCAPGCHRTLAYDRDKPVIYKK